MINTSFDLELEKTNDAGEVEKETVKVVMQEVSPFILSDVFMSNLAENNRYKIGSIIQDLSGEVANVIVSPKNLKERIEESGNSIEAITKVFNELNSFCSNPKRYALLQKESETKSKGLGHGDSESDVDRNKANE